jgi:hypothetical protein
MIPRLSFSPDPEPPGEAHFGIPQVDPETGERDLGYFHEVWPISDVPVDLAVAVLSTELRLARLIDQSARDAREFELLAAAVESPSPEYVMQAEFAHINAELMAEISDEFPPELGGLELGVAGLVLALAVHGCIPAASCRGHFGELSEPRWADRPVVYIAAEKKHIERLVPLARVSGCGFGLDEERPKLIVVEAPSIVESMQLADEILGANPSGLSPEHRARLAEAKTEPPDLNQGVLW